MPKRILFTNITPLPPGITRELAIAMLHNHNEMIELNPLVIEHHPIKTPRDAPADEFLDCVWQEMTDKIHYLPGGLVKGKVSYKACFHDLPWGLQTHIYAPMGLDIREKWSIGGSLPGEPPEARELGVNLPRDGLYLREDGDLKCNMLMSGFVRKNLDHAHKVLVERLLKKAQRIEEHHATVNLSHRNSVLSQVSSQAPAPQPGSHMSTSAFIQSPTQSTFGIPGSPQMMSPHQDTADSLRAEHPAFRNDDNRFSTQSLPPYLAQNQRQSYYSSADAARRSPQEKQRAFIAELPGSTYHPANLPSSNSSSHDLRENRASTATELSGSETARGLSSPNMQSDRSSVTSDTPPGQYRYNPQDFATSGQSGLDRGGYASEMVTPPMQSAQFQQQQYR